MDVNLQNIFRSGFADYMKKHGVSTEQYRAAQSIMNCHSEALGFEKWVCKEDGHVETAHHSCHHRSCPQCHGKHTHEWLEKVNSRILPCDHYHIIFTLPHELNDVWKYNRKWFSSRLIQAAVETLRELLRDERYLGAEVGIIASLHTWGRTLSFHPHVHLLVTGGGLDGQGQWQTPEKDFLLPVAVVKSKFRGKWLNWLNLAYGGGEIQRPAYWSERQWMKTLSDISKKKWNIRIQGSYKHGKGVATYLSRYVKGGPIKDDRLVGTCDEKVSFRYQDHRDGKEKVMRLTEEHFIGRVLSHVPEKGCHQVRYYGLYAPRAVQKRNIVRAEHKESEETPYEVTKEERLCPECGRKLWHLMSSWGKNSYIRCNSHVQQDDHADISTWLTEKRKPPDTVGYIF